jgi:hypothetical protein
LATLAIGAGAGAGVVGADGVRHYHVKPKTLCGIPPADYQPSHPPPVVAPVTAISEVGFVITAPLAALSPPATIVTPLPTTVITPPATTVVAPPVTVVNRPATTVTPSALMSLQTPSQIITPAPRTKVFQFIPTSMQIDHCSISRMALYIQDNGLWRLTLQADQNPIVQTATALTTVQPSTANPPALLTAPIRGLPKVTWRDTSFIKRNLFVIRVRGLGSFQEPIPVPAAPATIGKPVLFELAPIEFWVQNGVSFPLVAQQDPSLPHADIKQFFDMIDRVEIEFSYR